VKSGDVVRVKVLEVDEARKRISLTLRLDDEVSPKQPRSADQKGGDRGPRDQKGRPRDQKGGPRDQKGAQRGGDQRGRGGDRRGGGGRQGGSSGGSGGSGGGLANSAMADALRRAGLTGDRKD
ncbi:MAG TPA: RNA-binding transcriptional accessory protein, partial [Pseudonocardia sp.]